jgi:hypothetical protein
LSIGYVLNFLVHENTLIFSYDDMDAEGRLVDWLSLKLDDFYDNFTCCRGGIYICSFWDFGLGLKEIASLLLFIAYIYVLCLMARTFQEFTTLHYS